MTEHESNRLYQIIGERIRAARKRAPLSQEALAERVEVSRVSIVNIERGRQRPPLHLLWDISEQLGVELVDLIPREREFVDSESDVRLDQETVTKIEEAAKGNLVTRRRLMEFIEMAKSGTEELP